MDIQAVIRVIYKPTSDRVSMKEQRFFDGNGRPVTPPRTFSKMPEFGTGKRESQGKP
jgi:hypothetical protein